MQKKVVLDMSDSSALVSVGILSTLLSEKHKDYLDLISPFVLTLLPSRRGELVEVEPIIKGLKEQFGFEEFPHYVLEKLFSRFSKQKYGYLKRNNNRYYVHEPYP